MRDAIALPVLLALAACAAERPARFADVPAIDDVRDDAPIALPRRHDPVKETALTNAYVKRPVVEALDPTRAPEAGDVNALDDVPRSSWFSPGEAEAEEAADAAQPPEPPFRLIPGPAVTHEGALAVMDARGRRFEVWRDPPDRNEMSTGAAAAANHLLRAMGYLTPGVWALDIARADLLLRAPGDQAAVDALVKSGPPVKGWKFRVGVVRWPIGTDLGPTPPSGSRLDDPNDRVPHEDRRTLRALKLIFGWLGMTQGDATVFRDAYLGAPGQGHLVHYVAGLGGAFGANDVVRPHPPRDDDGDLAGQNVWITLATLGLYQQRLRLTPERWPAIGEYRETFTPADFQTGPPIEPLDRLLPADAYWAAKRVASLRPAAIVKALDAGHYRDDSARALLQELIRDRQVLAVRWGFAQVTPCEVDRLVQGSEQMPRAALVLRDEALSMGILDAPSTRYRIELMDENGKAVAPTARIRMSEGALFPIRLPETAPHYLVVRVRASRSRRDAPGAMEVHLTHEGPKWRVVGVVH